DGRLNRDDDLERGIADRGDHPQFRIRSGRLEGAFALGRQCRHIGLNDGAIGTAALEKLQALHPARGCLGDADNARDTAILADIAIDCTGWVTDRLADVPGYLEGL